MAFCRDCVRVGVFGVGGCCRESTPDPSTWYSVCLRSIFNWFLFRNECLFVDTGSSLGTTSSVLMLGSSSMVGDSEDEGSDD